MEISQPSIDDIIKDEKESANAKMFADLVLNEMGKNWFTLDEFVIKCKLADRNDALVRLLMLEQFDYCLVKNAGSDVVKKHRGKTLFKISFDNNEMLKQIDSEIEEYKSRIKSLKKRREKFL